MIFILFSIKKPPSLLYHNFGPRNGGNFSTLGGQEQANCEQAESSNCELPSIAFYLDVIGIKFNINAFFKGFQ